MKIIVEELKDNLVQEIELENFEISRITNVRPYFYFHNNPSGTFKIQILKGLQVLSESTFTCNDLKTALNTTDNFFHGHFDIQLPVFSLNSGVYSVKLTHSGYAFSETSYLAWVRSWVSGSFPVSFIINSDYEKPLAIEFWEHK